MSTADPSIPASEAVQARACAILEELLDGSPDDRRRALADLEVRDRPLHSEVTALLAHVPKAEWESRPAPPYPTIDDFELVRELGRGGMGVVYLARRTTDEAEQEYALKVLKRGMDTEGLIARFDREQRAMRRLADPRIARLHAVGSTLDGRPWFAMDLACGLPITTFCDAHGLSIRERVILFREVCAAVAHVHGRQVLHRDIKPGNILVNPTGAPVLVDFGVAKIIDPTDAGTFATTAMRPLTVQYASPQQLVGAPPAPSDDVYALGLVLYELLVGRPPYVVDATDPVAAAHFVASAPITSPSRALSRGRVSLAYLGWLRSAPAGNLRRSLHGNLDAITMKALERDDAHRYASAHSLVEDLTSFLEERTTDALSRRRLRQYRVATAAATFGVMVGAVGFVQARADRIDAELAAETDVQRLELDASYPTAIDTEQAPEMTQLDGLGQTLLNLDLTESPEVLWTMLDFCSEASRTIGSLRTPGAGQPLHAAALLETVVARRRDFSMSDPALDAALRRIASAHRLAARIHARDQSRWSPKAKAALRNDLTAARDALANADRATDRMRIATAISDVEEIITANEIGTDEEKAVLEALRRVSPMTLATDLQRLGDARCKLGQYGAAEAAYGEALELARRYGDVSDGRALTNVATAAEGAGLLTMAREIYIEVKGLRESAGDDERTLRNLARTLARLASISTKLGRHQEALDLYRQAIAKREAGNADAADVALTQYSLIGALLRENELSEAIAVAGEVESILGASDPRDRILAHDVGARVDWARDDGNAALTHLDALDALVGPEPTDDDFVQAQADGALLRAEILFARGSYAAVNSVLTDTVIRLGRATRDSRNARLELRMARAAIGLGRVMEGQDAADQLARAREILTTHIDTAPERADLRHLAIDAVRGRLRLGTDDTKELDLRPWRTWGLEAAAELEAIYEDAGDERRLAAVRTQAREIEAYLQP